SLESLELPSVATSSCLSRRSVKHGLSFRLLVLVPLLGTLRRVWGGDKILDRRTGDPPSGLTRVEVTEALRVVAVVFVHEWRARWWNRPRILARRRDHEYALIRLVDGNLDILFCYEPIDGSCGGLELVRLVRISGVEVHVRAICGLFECASLHRHPTSC